jgi:hypothetical protein
VCPPGSHVDTAKACKLCIPGRATIAENLESECPLCEAGKFINETGSSACIPCEDNKDSTEGAIECDRCLSRYFKDAQAGDFTCTACPDNAVCEGGLAMPVPTEGYWIDRSKTEYADATHRCIRNSCKGGVKEENSDDRPASAAVNRRLQSAQATSITALECWSFENYTAKSSNCAADELLCKKGAGAVLCGSCDADFFYSSTSLTCERCTAVSAMHAWLLLAGAGAIYIFYAAVQKGYVPLPEWIESLWIIAMFSNIDSGCFKIIFSSYQIIRSVSFTIDHVFPSPFSDLLNFMSIFSFDVSTLDCSSLAGNRVYNAVYAYSITPIIIASFIAITGAVRAYLLLPVTRRAEVYAQHSYALLLLSYVVVPPVTTKQFRSLNCFELNGLWLREDSSINCEDSKHKEFTVLVVLLIMIYMAIPLCWMVLLRRVRHRLVPNGVEDAAIVVEMRDKDEQLTALRFLFKDYKVHYFHWEALEMIRRVLFSGAIPVMAKDTFERGLIGLALSLASIILYREMM